MVIQHTSQPITTGASIIGIKYKDGVLIAGDRMCAYGNSLKYPGVPRIHQAGDSTLVGCSGEYSDFQHLQHLLDDVDEEDWIEQDGSRRGPKELGSFLGRVYYNRRSKGDPLWNQLVIGGIKPNGEPHLGYVDLQGTCFEEDFLATGFGLHLAMPILRKHCDNGKWKTLTEEQARVVVQECLELLFYRDCKASCEVQMAFARQGKTGKEIVKIEDPYRMKTFWEHKTWMKPGSERGTGSW
ncbi:unnamed protein product [Amoebophrya sp. A25]|nr:unnamed protein product [Amoebophrya sp. A25]|eukprot:GSA25T00009121001.1